MGPKGRSSRSEGPYRIGVCRTRLGHDDVKYDPGKINPKRSPTLGG